MKSLEFELAHVEIVTREREDVNMAIIKCKMCGGDLMFHKESPIAKCKSCETIQTVPVADDEKKLTLFARANRLRRMCDFDKAARVYDNIVADFPEEAEAYWGLVLCKYGIEYVDDPTDGKKIPVCHRTSFDSVIDDANYEQALENTDSLARTVYRKEAKEIDILRKTINEVSAKVKPYDIFICNKGIDRNGNCTLDSDLGQSLYDLLTAKGYKVFFSRITLADKQGQNCEPFIFAALNSARVMLAVGTDYEHYNDVWVKNEWSRFLRMKSSEQKKILIPCYKDIDTYDMPREFAKLKAYDLGNPDDIQNLLISIEKTLQQTGEAGLSMQNAVQEAVRTMEEEKNRKLVENAVSLGILAVDAGDTSKAKGHFEEALKLDPECIGAYLGLVRIITDINKAAPYVKKILSMPVSIVLDYIKDNKGIIGNLQNTNNLLTTAVKTIRSEDIISGILNIGVKGDAKDALIYYVDRFNNIAIIRKMIECGANVNATIVWQSNYKKEYDSYFEVYRESYHREVHSVLSTAVDAGRSKEIIALLVKAGANCNYVVKKYSYYHDMGKISNGALIKSYSVLSLAVTKSNKTDVPEVLIKGGANVNYVVQEDKDVSYSILGYAVYCKKYDIAKLLLANGADPNKKRTTPRKYSYRYYDGDVWSSSTVEEYSPISDTIWRTKDKEMLQLLLNFGGDPNALDKRTIVNTEDKTTWLCGYAKYNPLMDAYFYSTPDFIPILLDNGADPNIKYYYEGISDYSCATVNHKTEIPFLGVVVIAKDRDVINMLMEAGASFATETVYQTRGRYIDSPEGGTYEWNEDRFPLSEYSFTDEVLSKVGDIIRANGWQGKKFGLFGKTHRVTYRA